jgi:hypothetical protein
VTLGIQDLYLSKITKALVEVILPCRCPYIGYHVPLCGDLHADARRLAGHEVAQRLKLVSAEMGKHLISTTFAGLLVIFSSPGFASGTTKPESEQTTQAPVAVQRVAVPSRGLRDEATMVLIGTALIGLAAAVRRVA